MKRHSPLGVAVYEIDEGVDGRANIGRLQGNGCATSSVPNLRPRECVTRRDRIIFRYFEIKGLACRQAEPRQPRSVELITITAQRRDRLRRLRLDRIADLIQSD